jgi:hypothetical protein
VDVRETVMARTRTTGKKQKLEQLVGNVAVTVAMPALAEEHFDISTLETWLWDAACAIRRATDAPIPPECVEAAATEGWIAVPEEESLQLLAK